MTAPAQRYAWRESTLIKVVVTAIIGLVAIAAGWFGASGSTSVVRQTAWLEVAIAGFTVAAAGNCLWLLRARKAIGERRHALITLEAADVEPGRPRPSVTSTASLELVRAEGMTRVHYRDCPLVDGKPLKPADLSGGEPCGVCAA